MESAAEVERERRKAAKQRLQGNALGEGVLYVGRLCRQWRRCPAWRRFMARHGLDFDPSKGVGKHLEAAQRC